jgi:hypothetical protein
MTAEGWEKLQAAIPELVYVDFDDDAEPIQISQFVRLRDSGTGRDIVFYENGGAVQARVMVPPDPVAAQQLLSVLQTQPLWFQPDDNEQRFKISPWSPTHSEPSELREVSASVVAVMRDGLGMELERIRYTAGDETGFDRYRGDLLIAEQPTQRGAPDRCTDWTDFAERLEWVLCTMPGYDIVTLMAPAVKDLGSIQFQQVNGRLEASMITADTVPGSGDLDLRLRALGWRVTEGPGAPDVEWLYGPFSSSAGFVDRSLDRIPQLTVDTFRTVHGINSPQELAVNGRRDTVVSGNQAYIGRELGIPIQAYEQ